MRGPKRTRELARAKVNLCLHITGRRDDGYHTLDSLVAFADIGDDLAVEASDNLSLSIDGPGADGLPVDDGNLVLAAAKALRDEYGVTAGASLSLSKRLPIAAGLGGGSADAAAALRLLCGHWGLPFEEKRLNRLALRLGADVPVCLDGRPARMRGIGEQLTPVQAFPALPVVLVNPGVALATPDVFRATTRHSGSLVWPTAELADAGAVLKFLAECGNDLQPAAQSLVPEIAIVLDALAASPGCGVARMSGSGASCFGLFGEPVQAAATARQLRTMYGEWWVADGLLAGDDR